MTILLVIVALSLLVLIHEFGHFAAAKLFGIRVDEFGIGFPPRIFSRARGETRYSVNLLPFGGFVRIFGEDEPPSAGDPDATRAFAAKPLGKRALVVGAGILMNLLAGWLLLSFIFMIGAPSRLAISEVAPDSPAAAAGLVSGDLIIAARARLPDGQARVPERQAGGEELHDPMALDAFVALVGRAAAERIPVALTVERSGEPLAVEIVGRTAPPEGEGALGVALFDTGIPRAGIFESFAEGARATFSLLKAIIEGLVGFFAGLFAGAGGFETVTGPVGIVAVAVSSVSLGMASFLNLMAVISLHLALLNFLPLPALDGGRLFFLVLEKVKGSPVSRRIERATHAVGFALLLLLMVVVTARDIGRLIP